MTIAEMIAAGAVGRLQNLAHASDKETRKAARKGLHILRTRGMDAPVPPPPDRRPLVAPPRARPGAEGPDSWRGVHHQPAQVRDSDIFDLVMSGKMDPKEGVERMVAAGKMPGAVLAGSPRDVALTIAALARDRLPGAVVLTEDDLGQPAPPELPFLDPTVALLAVKGRMRRRRRRDPEEK